MGLSFVCVCYDFLVKVIDSKMLAVEKFNPDSAAVNFLPLKEFY